MTMKMLAEVRDTFTSSAMRTVRNEKKVPAVVYGKMTTSVAIAVDEKAVHKALRSPNVLIELAAPGQFKKLVILHAVQRHPVDQSILTVDFHQVDLDERIKAHIHIEPIPDPEGKTVPYQMFLHEIQVDCLPDQIPPSISLDLTLIREGKAILVKDLPIPQGVNVLTRADEVVASPFHSINETVTETVAVEATE